MLWTGQKGGKVKHRLIVQLVAHRNASVTSNNAPSGILAIGSGRRVVVKREATINPHTKYFNCEFVGFFFSFGDEFTSGNSHKSLYKGRPMATGLPR